MLAMIGSDAQTGTLRWTFGSLYLWDHLPLVPVTLGIFAIPELADMAIARTSIAGSAVAHRHPLRRPMGGRARRAARTGG